MLLKGAVKYGFIWKSEIYKTLLIFFKDRNTGNNFNDTRHILNNDKCIDMYQSIL